MAGKATPRGGNMKKPGNASTAKALKTVQKTAPNAYLTKGGQLDISEYRRQYGQDAAAALRQTFKKTTGRKITGGTKSTKSMPKKPTPKPGY